MIQFIDEAANMFPSEPKNYTEYSPEAQAIKIKKAQAKREMRRKKRLK